ncbi:hypothetical protein LCL95_01400 [Bacillus timonensis]|nr:hypothetical protein [Bacillus timonensis]
MYYDSVGEIVGTLLFWWVMLLVFQRVFNRYPNRNMWKKDLLITFTQSAIILILFPIARFFITKL